MSSVDFPGTGLSECSISLLMWILGVKGLSLFCCNRDFEVDADLDEFDDTSCDRVLADGVDFCNDSDDCSCTKFFGDDVDRCDDCNDSSCNILFLDGGDLRDNRTFGGDSAFCGDNFFLWIV